MVLSLFGSMANSVIRLSNKTVEEARLDEERKYAFKSAKQASSRPVKADFKVKSIAK